MKFKPGDTVRVVNCYSGGNFENGDIVTIHQFGYEADVYGAISPHDGELWMLCEDEVEPLFEDEVAPLSCEDEVELLSCEYCRGERNLALTNHGKVYIYDAMLTITGRDYPVRASINFCPMCGRPF